MGALRKLSRLVMGEARGSEQEVAAALVESYIDCARRAAQLERHGDMAPQRYSARILRELAAEEEKQVERLRQAIEAGGTAVPSVPPGPPPRGALNHWARVVQDLEEHRLAVQRLRSLRIRFGETFPQTAVLFDVLCRGESAHCEDLRALIARADPQALD